MEQVAYAIEEQVNDTYEHELEDQPNLPVAYADTEEASLVPASTHLSHSYSQIVGRRRPDTRTPPSSDLS